MTDCVYIDDDISLRAADIWERSLPSKVIYARTQKKSFFYALISYGRAHSASALRMCLYVGRQIIYIQSDGGSVERCTENMPVSDRAPRAPHQTRRN